MKGFVSFINRIRAIGHWPHGLACVLGEMEFEGGGLAVRIRSAKVDALDPLEFVVPLTNVESLQVLSDEDYEWHRSVEARRIDQEVNPEKYAPPNAVPIILNEGDREAACGKELHTHLREAHEEASRTDGC